MNARQLLNEFQHISSAKNGIQRVKELVLQLSILGDLSTHIAGDDHALALFLANKNAQERWTSENNFKRQSLLKKIVKCDEPWQLPAGWLWCRLGDVTSYGYSTKVEFKEVNNQTWVLELEDIEKGTSHLLQRVHACDRKFKSAKNRFKSGTVLYGKLRPYLDKVIIADNDGVCSTEIATISFFHGIHPGYLRWYLKSPFFIAYATNSTHGMSLPRLGTHDARNAPFPFPPAEEQKCIVAKIDELILLCDKLEAQREQREKLSRLVRTSTFQALSDAETVSDLQVAWSRVRQNMSLFLDSEQGCIDLQSCLKKLAVRGLLSDWTDDIPPLDEIKEQCAVLKQEYICKDWLRRRNSIVSKTYENDTYPPHWVVVPLDEVAVVIGGVAKGHRLKGQAVGSFAYLRVANVQRGFFDLTEIKQIEVPLHQAEKYHLERGDLLVAEGGDWDKVGRTAIWTGDIPNCLHQNHVFKVRVPSPLLVNEWVELVLNSYVGRDYFAGASKQTTNLASINMTQLRGFPLPIPPISEQISILEKIKFLLSMCRKIEHQHVELADVAELLTKAIVSSITGIQVEEKSKMKVPKTEVVSTLRIGVSPANSERAPLAAILIRNNGEMSTKSLWNASGLQEIDVFYQQLKTEMAKGWIVQPEVAYMKEVEA